MRRYFIIGIVFICAGILISYAADRTDDVIVTHYLSGNSTYTNTTNEHLLCRLTLRYDYTGQESPELGTTIPLETTGWTRTFELRPRATFTYYRDDAGFIYCVEKVEIESQN
jgi:hypothetical protein